MKGDKPVKPSAQGPCSQSPAGLIVTATAGAIITPRGLRLGPGHRPGPHGGFDSIPNFGSGREIIQVGFCAFRAL